MFVMSVSLHKILHVSAGLSSSAFKNSITLVIAVVVYIAGAVSLYIDLDGKNRIECVILLKIMESWLEAQVLCCHCIASQNSSIIVYIIQFHQHDVSSSSNKSVHPNEQDKIFIRTQIGKRWHFMLFT
ncbi:unnamed protein product [Vicia faba]|uniref:Uncharacterized protein n=1 Tax=Vicia faba TaxID=3906 RepID=A0AAV0Z2V8_VICFA|nr:unnamed protein product [Vicia faba]